MKSFKRTTGDSTCQRAIFSICWIITRFYFPILQTQRLNSQAVR